MSCFHSFAGNCSNLKCKFQSDTYSAFGVVEVVPSRSAKSVQDALNNQYLPEEKVPIKCSSCGVNVLCTRQYSVYKYPAVLVVMVKRSVRLKRAFVTTVVLFYECLNFNFCRFRYMSRGKDIRTLEVTESVELPGGVKYKLCSLVVHKGPTQDEGHYITAAKCTNGTLIAFDDTKVMSITVHTPYLFFK